MDMFMTSFESFCFPVTFCGFGGKELRFLATTDF